MGVPKRVTAARLSEIATNRALRADPKYRLSWAVEADELYADAVVPTFPLRRAVVPFRRERLRKGPLDEEVHLVELEDVEQRTGVILSSEVVTEIGSDKLLFGDADVLTTRLRPNLGKTILNDLTRRLAGTTEWIPIKVNAELLHPKLLTYYLLSPRYVDRASRLLSGKEHPRLLETDLLSIRVPFLDAARQTALVNEIAGIERQIDEARKKIEAPGDVIDEIISREFRFPLHEVHERTRVRVYDRALSAFGAASSLRSSAGFHHPEFEFVEAFLRGKGRKRVRAFLSVPIRLGATATRGDLLDEGDAYYVHPGATKHQDVINLADCYQVTEDYYEDHRRRFALTEGDIVMNRSGQAIGKVALFNSAARSLASDFTMRIRVSRTEGDPWFMWYYFRSTVFQLQIRRAQQGSSLPNVFPGQVEAMWVPECPADRQRAIAAEIRSRLEVVASARREILAMRGQVERAIVNAIS